MTFRIGDSAPPLPTGASPFHEWFSPDGTLWTAFYRTREGYLLRFPQLADFAVDADGQRVTVWPAAGVLGTTVQHLYLNQVLPLALSHQGKLVLHGSAVEVEGQAVAFIGLSGRGKSTLAASFATCGFRFLSDDGLVLSPAAEGYQVQPGHASLRLWQDSEEALLRESAEPAPTVQYTGKARFLASPTIPHCDEPLPVRRLFFLGDGSAAELSITSMRASEALVELVKNSFILDTSGREPLSIHFAGVSTLASMPIRFRLDFPRRYDVLPSVREAIIRHVAQG